MRIVVSATDSHKQSDVDPHFGRCSYFVLYDDQMKKYLAFHNMGNTVGGGAGVVAAQLLVDQAIDKVITANIGPNALHFLVSCGVGVYHCPSGQVDQAIQLGTEGKLKPIIEPGPAHLGKASAARGRKR